MNDKKQVATKEKGNALATAESFEMLGSAGFDEVTTDDIAIPFLRILLTVLHKLKSVTVRMWKELSQE